MEFKVIYITMLSAKKARQRALIVSGGDRILSDIEKKKKNFILIYCLQHVVLHNSYSFKGTSFFSTCNSLQIEQRPEPYHLISVFHLREQDRQYLFVVGLDPYSPPPPQAAVRVRLNCFPDCLHSWMLGLGVPRPQGNSGTCPYMSCKATGCMKFCHP